MTTNRSICLFGLSADPPTGTGGHVGMVQALQTFFQNQANETTATSASKHQHPQHTILIAPVYRHTFASKRNRLETFDHRLAMTRLAFGNACSPASNDDDHASCVRVIVSDVERRAFDWAMQKQQQWSSDDEQNQAAALSFGTATLLDYLKSTKNEYTSSLGDGDDMNASGDASRTTTTSSYSLALGADTFCDLMHGKWKESQRVLQLVDQLYVFARKDGNDTNSSSSTEKTTPLQTCLQMAGPRATLLQVDHLQGVSSSMARDCTDIEMLRTMVPEAVLQYMLDHYLYAIGKQQQHHDDEE